jgi:hypothetical protein
LQGVCEGSKRVLFFSFAWVSHMEKTLEKNFCFGLVCKVVVEVQQNFILFIYMGAPQVKKLIFPLVPNFIN